MKIAISGLELTPFLKPAALVVEARNAGADGVELWYRLNASHADDVRVIADAGLLVSGISTSTQLLTPERMADDETALLDACRLASETGIPLVSTYCGYPRARDDERNVHELATVLRRVLRDSDPAVTITVENEYDVFGFDPNHHDPTRRVAGLRLLMEAVDSQRLGVTLDPANFVISSENVDEAVTALSPWIRKVHFKNVAKNPSGASFRRVRDGRAEFATCAFNEGALDWIAILASSRDWPTFSGWVVLEPHADNEAVRQQWQESSKWLRQISLEGVRP